MPRHDDKPLVVHVITRLELGGAQRNTLYTVEHLDPERFRKALVTGRGGRLDGEARAGRSFNVHFIDSLVRPVRPWSDLRALWGLTRLLRRLRPGIVHTHSSKAGVLGRLAARLAGVPFVIHSVHGFSFSPFHPPATRWLYRLAERIAAPLTTRFLCVSRANLEEGIRLGLWKRERAQIVRSGIPLDRFRDPRDGAEVRAELGIPVDAPVVGSVGNFKPQKAPLDLIEAFDGVVRELPAAHLVVAGDGPLRADVEARVRELDLEDRVHLLGWCDDVPRLLGAFDVFLLVSLWEGLPRSLVQARAAGLAVVATAVDGSAEAVDDGVTGFLVPPRDPAAAAERVVRLLRDPDLRRGMGEVGRESLEEFDIDAMVRQQERIYQELLRPGRRKADAVPGEAVAP